MFHYGNWKRGCQCPTRVHARKSGFARSAIRAANRADKVGKI